MFSQGCQHFDSVGKPFTPATNWYSYAGNNPINFRDPMGLEVYPPPGDEPEIDWPDFIDTPCKRRCYTLAQGCKVTGAGRLVCTPIGSLFAKACIQSFCEVNDLCMPDDFSGS